MITPEQSASYNEHKGLAGEQSEPGRVLSAREKYDSLMSAADLLAVGVPAAAMANLVREIARDYETPPAREQT